MSHVNASSVLGAMQLYAANMYIPCHILMTYTQNHMHTHTPCAATSCAGSRLACAGIHKKHIYPHKHTP